MVPLCSAFSPHKMAFVPSVGCCCILMLFHLVPLYSRSLACVNMMMTTLGSGCTRFEPYYTSLMCSDLVHVPYVLRSPLSLEHDTLAASSRFSMGGLQFGACDHVQVSRS